MPSIKIGQTSKPVNSTSQVFESGAKTLSCVLKNSTSIHNPVFIVEGLDHNVNYNFAQWGNNYYWIDDIKYMTNKLFEVSCHLDPLATYKMDIRKTNYLVKYCIKSKWNKWVDDIRFNPEKQATHQTYSTFQLFNNTDVTLGTGSIDINTTGTVFLRVMETAELQSDPEIDPQYPTNRATHQGVNTYAMTPTIFRNCLMDLADDLKSIVNPASFPNMTDIEFLQCVCKLWASMGGAGSWRENIISVTFVPIDYDDIPSSMYESCDGVLFGCIPSKFACKRMLSPINIWHGHQQITIPWSTDTEAPTGSDDTKLAFLRNDRWCSMQVFTPAGYQPLSISSIKEQTQIGAWCSLNVCTGEWTLRLTEKNARNAGNGGETLCSFSGNIGVDLTGFIGNGSSVGSQFNGFATKVVGAVLGGQVGMPSMGENIATSLLPTGVESASASGGVSGDISSLFNTYNFGECYIFGQQYRPLISASDYIDFCNKHGFPCNQWLNPYNDNFTGYIETYNANVVDCVGATSSDKEYINNILNSGIYIA